MKTGKLVRHLTKNNSLSLSEELISTLKEKLESYQKDLLEAKSYLSIKGKTIGEANKEQTNWPYYCDERRIELNILVKELEASVDYVKSNGFKRLTEKSSRDLSDRAKSLYIESDPEYIEMQSLLLEVSEVRDKFSALVDAYKGRGYALKNVVDSVIHEVQDFKI